MANFYARPLGNYSGWALLCLSLASSGCRQCPRDEQSSTPPVVSEGISLAGERILDHLPKNCLRENSDRPLLFARFIDALDKEKDLPIKALLAKSNQSEALCPPGPYLVDGTQAVDLEENKWQFSSMPDYFVWYAPTNPAQYEFYLANQGGFPLKAQSLKLHQDQDSLVMLLPKSQLENGKIYYLYLIEKSGASKQTWIQPLSLAKK